MRRRRSSGASSLENDRAGGRCPSVGVDIHNGNVGSSEMEEKESMTMGATDTAVTDYRRFYFLHSALVLLVLVTGIIHNGGNRKYIPVNPKELSNFLAPYVSSEIGSCRKAYVNVHSSAIEEDGAAYCCPGSDYSSSFRRQNWYQSNLCHPRMSLMGVPTQQLPFARRLTRLLEAWVLPLLPIIIRLIYQLVALGCSVLATHSKRQKKRETVPIQREATSFSTSHPASSSSSSSLSSNAQSAALLDKCDDGTAVEATAQPNATNLNSIRTTLQRFLFYFLLLNFRGWGLYIGANALEDYVILPWLTGNTVVSPLRTNSMSDVEHDLQFSGNEPQCWYKDVLKEHHKSAMENDGHSDCYGRPFDFSDHVVLFLAHYLPIFVIEMLVCYHSPFWGATERSGTKQRQVSGVIWKVIHAILFLYLHLIVLQALYQTTVYFHTPGEILVGYAVSLTIQLPVAYLMCSEKPQWLRKILGLPSSNRGPMDEKGD